MPRTQSLARDFDPAFDHLTEVTGFGSNPGAYEAGRDGFWLARWLRARDVEAYVHPSHEHCGVREHRRAKTDRLDTELLMRAFLGSLRGEKRHCSMVAIPTIEEEDARRPNRERQNLVTEQTRIVNQMKAIFVRFGIRAFRSTLHKVEGKRAPSPAAAQSRAPSRFSSCWPGDTDDLALSAAKNATKSTKVVSSMTTYRGVIINNNL